MIEGQLPIDLHISLQVETWWRMILEELHSWVSWEYRLGLYYTMKEPHLMHSNHQITQSAERNKGRGAPPWVVWAKEWRNDWMRNWEAISWLADTTAFCIWGCIVDTKGARPCRNKYSKVQGVPCARRPGLGWLTWLWFPPSCPATSAKFPSAQAESGRQWNSRNQSRNLSQRYPVSAHLRHPVQMSWPTSGWKLVCAKEKATSNA